VAADLGLVADATQGHPGEGPAEGAGDRLAERRLAHPRRADQGDDGTRAPAAHGRQPALGPQLAHGEVLDDAVLHVLEAGVISIEDGPRLTHVEAVVGLLAPRDVEHGVEPGPDPAVLGALLAGALEPVKLALDRSPHRVGQGVELGPVLRDHTLTVAVLAQLLADGGHLLAQQELPLGLLHAVGHVALDALLERQVGQDVARPAQDLQQPGLDVSRLQHLHLLLEGEVGRVAGRVGHGAGVGDAPQRLGDAAGAAVVEDVLHDGAVLTGQVAGPGGGLGVENGVGLDPKSGPDGTGDSDADRGAVQAAHDHGPQAARQLAGVLELGHRAHAGVAVVEAGDEQDAGFGGFGRLDGGLGLVALDGHRHHHAGQHHAGGERQQGQGGRAGAVRTNSFHSVI
jgi:hypothetical protein